MMLIISRADLVYCLELLTVMNAIRTQNWKNLGSLTRQPEGLFGRQKEMRWDYSIWYQHEKHVQNVPKTVLPVKVKIHFISFSNGRWFLWIHAFTD